MRTAIILAAVIIVGHQDDLTTGEMVVLGLMFTWDLVEVYVKAVLFEAGR